MGDVVITGIGMLTSLGNGVQENWQALTDNTPPNVDLETFAPYPVHPLVETDWAEQIAKRDQRQMEPWQRIGTYAAGLALADAGLAEDEALKASMDMTIAAAGGERDVEVDTTILTEAAAGRKDTGVLVNEKLTTELRPTLFLAQLSNLLAGNISIVHKVTGSSRTFMGEEGAGLSAIQNTTARIRSGQSTHALIGASYNAEHPDMLLGQEVGHHLARGPWKPVFERLEDGGDNAGAILGSGGVFLVLEDRDHATKRGATIYATIDAVDADLGSNDTLGGRLERLAQSVGLQDSDMIVSTTTGSPDRTAIELDFLKATGKAFAETTSHFGSLRETQALLGTAIAALSLQAGSCPLLDDAACNTISVVTVGHDASEGMVALSRGDA